MVLFGLACFALSLWLVGVRDWRIYGVVALWPQFVGEMRVSHLTPVIMLLVAGAWRWRDTRGAPGLLVGLAVAIKFFVWPVGLWLAATRRLADAALAAAVAACSLLLLLPFTSLHDYVRRPQRLGQVFDQDSYNVYGLLVQAGAPDAVARVAMLLVGGRSSQRRGATGAWRSRSQRRSRSPPSSGSTTSRLPRCRSRSPARGSRRLVPAPGHLGRRGRRHRSATCGPICVSCSSSVSSSRWRSGGAPRRGRRPPGDVTSAARKAIEIAALGVVPLAALALGLATFAGQDRLALDFHHELFPQAAGRRPRPRRVPAAGCGPLRRDERDLADGGGATGRPAHGSPGRSRRLDRALLVIATLVAALWVFEVRDWRVYGITLLWPPVIDAYQTGTRRSPRTAPRADVALPETGRARGVALGVALAVKFFLWPVVLWLAAVRRTPPRSSRSRSRRPRCSCSSRSRASRTTCGSSAT